MNATPTILILAVIGLSCSSENGGTQADPTDDISDAAAGDTADLPSDSDILEDTIAPDNADDSADPEDTIEETTADGSDEPDSNDLLQEPEPLVLRALSVTANPANLLSFFAEWRSSDPATTVLEVSCGGGFQQTISSDDLETRHRVFVMGLWDGVECRVVARGERSDGGTALIEGVFEAEELPGFLPDLIVSMHEPWQIEPGWTLTNMSNTYDSMPIIAVLVDSNGRYRWYYIRDNERSGWDIDVAIAPRGVLIGSGGLLPPIMITWDGETIWEPEWGIHHTFQPWGDADLVSFLRTPESCEEGPDVCPLLIYDPINDEPVWRWLLCDHYMPPQIIRDWDHLNAAFYVPEDDAFILSARRQSALFKVSRESGEIEWILGYAGQPDLGFNGDFEMAEADRFLEQHAPEVQPNGNILLFDNGDCTACTGAGRADMIRGWSRASEIALDLDEMTAEIVWEFRPDPDIYAPIWGDADRLANGNTLVTFGLHSSSLDTHVIEVNRRSEEVWHLHLPPKWGAYRAERVAPRFGYVMRE
jgi:hypothetical protein